MIVLNTKVKEEALKLKKAMDAAYLVFKKKPSVENAATWTAATRAYNNFCVQTISGMLNELTLPNIEADIAANLEEYEVCKKCSTVVLHTTDEAKWVRDLGFVAYFPGWCYDCLVEHCKTTDCESCTATRFKDNCPFLEVKKLLK
jgi:hypothetical protein